MHSETSHSAWLYDALGWLDQNKTKLIVGVVVVAAVVLAYAVYRWNLQQEARQAHSELLSLELESEAETAAAPPAEFLDVVEQHPDTSAAPIAQLLAARQYYLEGNYAQTERTFQTFLNKYSNREELAPIAAIGLAACSEAQGRLEQAFSRYQQVISQYPEAYVVPQARFALARLLEDRGDLAEAVAKYSQLAEDESSLYWAGQARSRREQIFKEHPELKPAPAETSGEVSGSTETNLMPELTLPTNDSGSDSGS